MNKAEIDKRVKDREAANAHGIIVSALALSRETGQIVVIRPNPTDSGKPNDLVFELTDHSPATDVPSQYHIPTTPNYTNGIGIKGDPDIFQKSDGHTLPAVSPAENPPKKVKRGIIPPNPNLDPLKDDPVQVVRTPEGRDRARDVIAARTLENHISNGVHIDEDAMRRATDALTAPMGRRELAKRLEAVQASIAPRPK